MTSGVGGVFFVGPGVALVLLGIAILLWPRLFAFLVAGLLMAAGSALIVWGWRLNKAQNQILRRMQEQQEVGSRTIYHEYDQNSIDSTPRYY
jgi:membrane protein implicated in regulation of membrane protease activity